MNKSTAGTKEHRNQHCIIAALCMPLLALTLVFVLSVSLHLTSVSATCPHLETYTCHGSGNGRWMVVARLVH